MLANKEAPKEMIIVLKKVGYNAEHFDDETIIVQSASLQIDILQSNNKTIYHIIPRRNRLEDYPVARIIIAPDGSLRSQLVLSYEEDGLLKYLLGSSMNER